MDCLARLRQLMKQRGLSEYKLAQLSGIPPSTINSLFQKGNSPTIPTLEGLCKGLNISLSDFFYEPNSQDEVEHETQYLLSNWKLLNPKQKDALLEMIHVILEK